MNPTEQRHIEWALPLVVRIERSTPPTRTDALEAAARSVLFLLTADEPEWRPAIEAWDSHRIRKVVRRARGAAWERATQLPGITVTHRSASVRVFPPVPVEQWPDDLAKLQVGGTELTDPIEPPAPVPARPLVLLSPYVEMTAGKAMAQAGHAAQLGWRAASAAERTRWQVDGFALDVRDSTPAGWEAAVASGAPVVTDGGFTEVEPGTRTALLVPPRN